LWRIDLKVKHIHKYKHDHIYIHVQSTFVIVALSKGTTGRRRGKERMIVNNGKIHCICVKRTYNKRNGKLLKIRGWREKGESNKGG
jgi:hypothetical protein